MYADSTNTHGASIRDVRIDENIDVRIDVRIPQNKKIV